MPSVELCRDEADANGWFVVSDTSWPGYRQPPHDVMSGYGIMVDEIVEVMENSSDARLLAGWGWRFGSCCFGRSSSGLG